jgi:hypothetical protein
MNKVVLIFLFSVLYLFNGCDKGEKIIHENNLFSSPDFMEFENMRTRNPQTGKVDPADLMKAFYEFEERFGRPRNTLNKQQIFPYSWRPTDDYLATLSISRIVYDPQNTKTFYFCTGEGWFNADGARGAGVWKSTDAGATWNQLVSTNSTMFYYCQDMEVHPATGHVYVSTREGGLQRSIDGGNTWQKVLGTGMGSVVDRMADLELTADGELFVTAGIFQTDGIYFSESGDSGAWEKRNKGLPANIHRIEMATAPSDPNVAYCIPTSSGSDRRITGIFRTADKGINWMKVTTPGNVSDFAKIQGWFDLIIKVDPNNPNVVVAGGLNQWKSTDGGQTWKQIAEGDTRTTKTLPYMHVDQHEILFKGSDTVMFGNDGGIYKCDFFTSDSPLVYDVNKNYNVTQYYAVAAGPEANDFRVLGGTQDNGTYISTADGISDFEKLSWSDGGFCAVNHKTGKQIYTTTQYRRMYRIVNGQTDTISNQNLNDNNTLFINPMEMDPVDPEIIYQASNYGLWRLKNASTADYTKWQAASRPWGSISAIGIAVDRPNTVFFGRETGGTVFRIDDAHLTDNKFTPINSDKGKFLPQAGYASNIYVDPKAVNHILVTFSNYGVQSIFETKNALSDTPVWISVEGDLPDLPVRWAILHPGNSDVCYIATELGIFMTEKLDGDNTKWVPAGNNFPNLRVDMIRYRKSDKTFIIGTHGRGIFTAKNIKGSYKLNFEERGPRNIGGRTRTIMFDPNDPSGKKVWAGSVSGGLWVTNNIDSATWYFEIPDTLPEPKPISGFYVNPNPVVNGQAKILASVNKEAVVEISAYTITGQKLQEIYKGTGKENIEANWNTRGLATGLYIVQLRQGDKKKSLKVVVGSGF